MMDLASHVLGYPIFAHELLYDDMRNTVASEILKKYPLLPTFEDDPSAAGLKKLDDSIDEYGDLLIFDYGNFKRQISPADTALWVRNNVK